MSKNETVPLDQIRGLIIAQQGRCAITGEPLSPYDVNADHIVPLGRRELKASSGARNVWLVSKKVNAAKGSLTYDEFVALARQVIAHESSARTLRTAIEEGRIAPATKPQLDEWVSAHCDSQGRVKPEATS